MCPRRHARIRRGSGDPAVRLKELRRFRAAVLPLLWAFFTLGAAAAPPKRVLILNPFGRDVEPFSAAVSSFRSTLARDLGEPVDFHEIPLDLARFTGPEGEAPLIDFLDERIKSQAVDLVVPIGGAGVQFAARHRERLFPRTPVLVVAAEPRMIPAGFLGPDTTLVTQRIVLPGMVEDILMMQPDNARIAPGSATSSSNARRSTPSTSPAWRASKPSTPASRTPASRSICPR